MSGKNKSHRITLWATFGVLCVAGGTVPFAQGGRGMNTAKRLEYQGYPSMYMGAYEMNEPFMPREIRIQPLKAAKDASVAAISAIDRAGYDDLIGAVAYSNVIYWTEPLTDNYDRVQNKLSGLPIGGGTSLHKGMKAARMELLSERSRAETDKVMVLMTDGQSSARRAIEEAETCAGAGIKVHVVGLGTGVDHDMLDQIAEITGGIALYVDGAKPADYSAELEKVFLSIASEAVGIGLIE